MEGHRQILALGHEETGKSCLDHIERVGKFPTTHQQRLWSLASYPSQQCLATPGNPVTGSCLLDDLHGEEAVLNAPANDPEAGG